MLSPPRLNGRPQAALAEAHRQRAWHQQWFPSAVNRALGGVAAPDWLADAPVRTALLALARSAAG